MKEKNRILNDHIIAKSVQLIDEQWENLWNMSLQEAREKASSLWLDLMQMSKNWDSVIVKLMDYWKFLYKQKKQEQKNKQKWKAPDMKSLRITFQIWEHDLEIKRKQALKFAESWHPLKVTLMLRWRENNYWDIASEKINSFINSLSEVYRLEWNVNRVWNTFSSILKIKK